MDIFSSNKKKANACLCLLASLRRHSSCLLNQHNELASVAIAISYRIISLFDSVKFVTLSIELGLLHNGFNAGRHTVCL